MPVTELAVITARTLTLRRPGAPDVRVPEHRLRTRVRLGAESDLLPTILDTGAPVTFVDYHIWLDRHLRGQIDWDGADPDTPLAQLPTTPLLGPSVPYLLGRLQLRILGACGCPELDLGSMLVVCIAQTPAIPRSDIFLGSRVGACVLLGMNETYRERTLLLQASADETRWAAALSQPGRTRL